VQYAFDCTCVACTNDGEGDDDSFAAQSKDRRWRLRELEEAQDYDDDDTTAEMYARLETVVLLREEGLVLPRLGHSYMHIARLFRQLHDEQNCVIMAVHGIEVFATIFGRESISVKQATEWLNSH
jgi:hypothetical protein